ncbi:hypothetical protein K227x_01780 [Rubripirellula lacrimiformis]|uniref:DUF3299 domain-containing protein n=1 Tax=Rubripirellula lacrimiformis TaxID=1930273 RepID=A0A517N3U0_9BACT|nr:DUF3299 domain-containing protein [Rubripirellula lacrimiformis]QDT01810.1 hypothetical protein K227x_01780 [Rubripirellula lacrimiformis]
MPVICLPTIGRLAVRCFEVPRVAIVAIAVLGCSSLAVAQQDETGGGNGVKVIDQSSSAASKAKGEINFDDLKFDIEKDAAFAPRMLSPDVKSLDGKKVKLRGYILPATLFKEKGINQFVLVRDNQECCFGPGAALFDCVMVQMMPGRTTDFVTRPVTVEGKFKIDTETYKYPTGVGPKGATHLAIFQIDGMSVK